MRKCASIGKKSGGETEKRKSGTKEKKLPRTVKGGGGRKIERETPGDRGRMWGGGTYTTRSW